MTSGEMWGVSGNKSQKAQKRPLAGRFCHCFTPENVFFAASAHIRARQQEKEEKKGEGKFADKPGSVERLRREPATSGSHSSGRHVAVKL